MAICRFLDVSIEVCHASIKEFVKFDEKLTIHTTVYFIWPIFFKFSHLIEVWSRCLNLILLAHLGMLCSQVRIVRSASTVFLQGEQVTNKRTSMWKYLIGEFDYIAREKISTLNTDRKMTCFLFWSFLFIYFTAYPMSLAQNPLLSGTHSLDSLVESDIGGQQQDKFLRTFCRYCHSQPFFCGDLMELCYAKFRLRRR